MNNLRMTSLLWLAVFVFSPITAMGQTADSAQPPAADEEAAPVDAPAGTGVNDPQLIEEYGLHPFELGEPISSCPSPFRNMFGEVEYLFWWRKGGTTPPLITTSPAGTAQGQAGVLGQPGTTILAGGTNLFDEGQPGGRLTVGKWFDPMRVNGVVFSLYSLGTDDANFSASANDFTIVGRPFFNEITNLQDAKLVTFPIFTAGRTDVLGKSDLVGGDLYARMMFSCRNGVRWDLVTGVQAARIDESLTISDNFVSLDPGGNIQIGTVLSSVDIFDVRNEYFGGTIGLMAELDRGPVTWSLLAKLGLGNMRGRVTIDGRTVVMEPNAVPTLSAGGLLAKPSNIGEYKQSQFAISPEVNLKAKWRLSERISLTAGYSLVYWSNVLRAGDQINLNIDPSQVPGPPLAGPLPQFRFRSSDYWVQGLSLGVAGEF